MMMGEEVSKLDSCNPGELSLQFLYSLSSLAAAR